MPLVHPFVCVRSRWVDEGHAVGCTVGFRGLYATHMTMIVPPLPPPCRR